MKRSLLCEAAGVPPAVVIDGANRHDMKLVGPTLDALVIERPEPGEDHPQGMCLDKGYDYDQVREQLAERAYEAHIRSRGEEKADKQAYPHKRARRWVVERGHSWLNRFRGILIRWCKKPANYEAMLHFACGIICYQQAGLFG